MLNAEQRAMVEANRDLVRIRVRALRRVLPPTVDFDDLQSYGEAALCEAAIRFTGAGASFRTYATHRIRGGIWDGLRATVWGPRHATVRKYIIPESDLNPVDDASPGLEQTHNADLADYLMQGLPTRERDVVRMLIFDNMRNRDVAAALGLTSGGVSAIKRRALERMRARAYTAA